MMHRTWFSEGWRIEHGLVVELRKVEMRKRFAHNKSSEYRVWDPGTIVDRVVVDYSRGKITFYEEDKMVGRWSVSLTFDGSMALEETE